MGEFLTTKGRIPTNLDLDEVLMGVEGNKTKLRFLKDGIVYFITLLTVDNYNYVMLEDGYFILKESTLSDIIGDKRPRQIVKILKSNNVIEYLPHKKNKYSRRYRLTESYNTGDYQYIEFSERIKEKLRIHKTENRKCETDPEGDDESVKIKLEVTFSLLVNQFTSNRLGVEIIGCKSFLKELGEGLLERTSQMDRYRGLTQKSLFNHIGRMVNLVEDIDTGHYYHSLSPSNHRFNSNLTSLPKILRPFLSINGQRMVEIDIGSSQPYILSTILNEEFTKSTENGFNLFTIYPKLFGELTRTRNIVPSKQIGNDHLLAATTNAEKWQIRMQKKLHR